MRKLLSIVFIAGLCACFGTLTGCKEEGAAEKTGASMDDAMDQAEDAAKDAGDAASDAMDTASQPG